MMAQFLRPAGAMLLQTLLSIGLLPGNADIQRHDHFLIAGCQLGLLPQAQQLW